MRPTIVRRIEGPGGALVKETRPLAVRRVLEPETVDTLNEILKEVVRAGTGRNAVVPGYTVAGKTGTAQKPDENGGYSSTKYVASFVGMVPATSPQLVVLVTVNEPKGAIWGGVVAAPAFAEIAKFALQYLEVPPDAETTADRTTLSAG